MSLVRRFLTASFLFLGLLVTGSVALQAQSIPLNTFNNGSTDLTSSYYVYTGGSTLTWSSTGGVGGTGGVTQISGGGSMFLYDTTPDTTPTNSSYTSFIVDLDFKGYTTSSYSTNFGIYFADGGNRTGTVSSLYYTQMATNSTTLNWRYGAQESIAGAGTAAGADKYTSAVKADNTWYHLTLTVTDQGNGTLLTTAQYYDQTKTTLLASGSYTYTSSTLLSGTTSGEIGVRFNPNGTNGADGVAATVSVDNLQVTVVPEPITAAMVCGGVILIISAGCRRRRHWQR